MFIKTQNIDLLKRAFPHLDDTSKQSVDVLLKVSELNTALQNFSHNELSACNIKKSSINSEELLKSIRPVCSSKEKELIDLVLGFSKSKEIINAYHSISNDKSGLSAIENLKNNLSKEQIQMIQKLDHIIQG
jgi:hypothetical protein